MFRTVKDVRDAEAFLEEGTGKMWNVRVASSHDELEYVDFEVRADDETMAADKAELVACLFSDFYFSPPSPPTYYADRHNVEPLDEED